MEKTTQHKGQPLSKDSQKTADEKKENDCKTIKHARRRGTGISRKVQKSPLYSSLSV